MFTFLSRFRRQTAVLTALALVASVLVAVPVSAADDDPKADYTATFSACVAGASEDAGFTDVPEGHANAGDIDCIAYYGITKGTSASTYSPLMSVTREHMALFLTRLAGLVGIEVASDPADPGFTDTGDLSEESQTAIAQLADLGITKGTSDTTYSPADTVTRGHMALFIARLMNKMDPMAEDSNNVFGYTPEDVGVVNVIDTDDNEIADEPGKAKSPFGDLQSSTKETYDAITNLWELGVASGINDTHYGPAQSITRASMAGFMAGVLDHSNARPMGVTIQASKTWDFGSFDPQVAVSYRDSSFAPMVDVSVKVFHSNADVTGGVGDFTEDGGCVTATDCAWTDDESLTDASGNIYVDGSVPDGKTNTYYAWMGDPDADENNFDMDDSPHASVALSSTTDAVNLKVTTDINENSTEGNTEDIDGDGSVTLTAQLVDGTGAAVAKPGVTVNVEVNQGGSVLYPAPASMKTDDDGKVTYTTSGPKSTKDAVDKDRIDVIKFMSNVDGDDTGVENTVADILTDGTVAVGDPDETVDAVIVWTDSNPTLATAAIVNDDDNNLISRAAVGKGKGSTPAYALRNSKNEVTIRASVMFYDQYGNPAGKGSSVEIKVGEADAVRRTISSRGVASWRETVVQESLNGEVRVTYGALQDSGDTTIDGVTVANTTVLAVEHAPDDSSNDAAALTDVYADENRFNIAGLLYTYDENDKFVNDVAPANGAVVDLDKFEDLIGGNLDSIGTQASVEVVVYDDDGSSIFRVTVAAQ